MSEPLTIAELAVIRERLATQEDREPGYGIVRLSTALRLLATLDAALNVVAKVAHADNSDNSVCYQLCQYRTFFGYDNLERDFDHNEPCVVEQARALLGEANDE